MGKPGIDQSDLPAGFGKILPGPRQYLYITIQEYGSRTLRMVKRFGTIKSEPAIQMHPGTAKSIIRTLKIAVLKKKFFFCPPADRY